MSQGQIIPLKNSMSNWKKSLNIVNFDYFFPEKNAWERIPEKNLITEYQEV